jgi:transcriptional regulator GlxA family with amidase domain
MKNRMVIAGALFFFSWFSIGMKAEQAPAAQASRIKTPAKDAHLRVAVVLSEGAVVIDFAGPWEVFQDVMIPSRGPEMEQQHPFELYTVSDSKAPIQASDGMRIVPEYTFDDAPAPNIVVIPAQSGRSPKMLAWVQKMSKQSEVVMSVCTGAFVLAKAGLLDGKKATTHHDAWDSLHENYPQITVERGARYVQSDPVIFTAGGLSSGIDLALHIVELYFGRDAALATASYMEYEGKGWTREGTTRASR